MTSTMTIISQLIQNTTKKSANTTVKEHTNDKFFNKKQKKKDSCFDQSTEYENLFLNKVLMLKL